MNLMQLPPIVAVLCEITCSDGHGATQCHSYSLILVLMETGKPLCNFLLVNNTDL